MTVMSNLSDNLERSSCIVDESPNWNTFYCSHLWSKSHGKKAIINGSNKDNNVIKYCYTCRGKIRNYGITSPNANFSPNNHSTPKVDTQSITEAHRELPENNCDCSDISIGRKASVTDININNVELPQYIPSISRHIDVSFRPKYTSAQYDLCASDFNQKRLKKSLKGIGCIVNFSLTDSAKIKRSQIQACSICVMIIAIVVISLILVNYTTLNFMHNTNVNSTILVPTKNVDYNETSSAIISIYTDLTITDTTEKVDIEVSPSKDPYIFTPTRNSTHTGNVLKVRKNVKTYPKNEKEGFENKMPNESDRLSCSCQKNEICLLDESIGIPSCKLIRDKDDPTGCGGLCALNTEACHIADKIRDIRVCRVLKQCKSDEWRCHNGLCVPSTARCNGTIQCYDRSDEKNCECNLFKNFRCGDFLSCFPNSKICDGVIDCWDGFDESSCVNHCNKQQFTCTDGHCIKTSRFCDGFIDCDDGSDEPQGCDTCGTNEMQCANNRCVPLTNRCDGKDDCDDNSDELDCS